MASRNGLLLASSAVRGCGSRGDERRSVFSFSSSLKRLELWASRSALCLALVSLTLWTGGGC